MRIAFVTEGTKLEHNSLETTSLGGSETALVSMARAMNKRGHKVTVFAKCDEEGNFDGIEWLNVGKFPVVSMFGTWDVLVVSRYAQHLTFPSNAGVRVLWLHDVLANSAAALAQCLFQTDAIFALSDWHIDNYTKGTTDNGKMPHFKPFFWKTSNGVDTDLIAANIRPKVSKKLIYTSRPERGLFFLLRDIMPRLIEKDPEITLSYCAYDLPGFPLSDEVKAIQAACDEMAATMPNNVKKLGALSKAELYQEISSAQIWSYSSCFQETYCIGAIEAAACGTAVVTTRDGALIETVADSRNGTLIPGQPGTGEYTNRYVEAILYLLKKERRLRQFQEHGPRLVKERGLGWAAVAEKWEKKFNQMLADRWATNKEKVVQEMVRYSDLTAARALCVQEGMDTAFVDAALESVTQELPTDFADVQRLVNRYNAILGRVVNAGIKVGTVLDLNCGPAPFGIHVAKASKGTSVWLVEKDEFTRAKLAASVEKLEPGVRDRITVMSPEQAEVHKHFFDLVFSGDHVDEVDDPAAYFRELSTWLNGDGNVVATFRFGASAGVLRDVKHTRKWNLSFYDIDNLFEGRRFLPAILDEGISTGGDLSGHWLVITDKETALNTAPIDIEHRKRIYRPYTSIAVAMIARDAEEWLIKCLKHVRPIADSITIALDDRTTDNTEAMALSHGVDTVKKVTFEDFSQMRNASIAGLTEDWIFWIDTDEMLVDSAKLRRYLRGPMFNGFGVKQNHLMLDVHGTFDVPIRLFRNLPQFKFNGKIHEHCLQGDAQIAVPGGYKQIKDLVGQKDFWVWTFSHADGRMVLRKAARAWKSGTKETIEILLDSGSLRCTPEHRIMLRNGEYCEARNLKPGDSVMPFYRGVAAVGGPTPARPNKRRQYEWVVALNNTGQQTVREHRYLWEQVVGEIPDGHHIHHVDGDHLNNALENLSCITHSEHSRLTATNWNAEDKQARGVCRAAEYTARSGKFRQGLRITRDQLLDVISDCNGCFTCVHNFFGYKDINAIYRWISAAGTTLAEIRAEHAAKTGFASVKRHQHIPMRETRFEGVWMPNNHKVRAIRAGLLEDVYDIEVPGTHNFVANGIVVHNCEDVSANPFGDPISPSILIPDVDLAHYGYLNEIQRRNKCSNRNMELLIADARENGTRGRMLSWVLVIRDYLNIAKWRLERSKQPVQPKTIEHYLIQAAIRTYLKFFADRKSKYHGLAWNMYQEALTLLGMSGVPFENRTHPPFEVRTALWGAVGGVQKDNVEPQKVWFIDYNQFLAYISGQAGMFGVQAGLVPFEAVRGMVEADAKVEFTWNEHDLDLLLIGANNIDPRTGRLLKV